MTLGLNDDSYSVPAAPKHRSPGLAFLLSFLIPGAGQFYCGKTTRGGFTLVVWLLSAFVSLGARGSTQGISIVVAFTLWIFAFLDAYFTAAELNAGVDLQAQNPRVATTLNLLTNGLGYFYLGERAKGMVLFIGMRIVIMIVQQATASIPALGSILLTGAGVAFGVDAYRIAKRNLQTSVDPEAQAACQSAVKSSGLPAYVPVALATLLVSGGLAAIVFTSFINSTKPHQHTTQVLDER